MLSNHFESMTDEDLRGFRDLIQLNGFMPGLLSYRAEIVQDLLTLNGDSQTIGSSYIKLQQGLSVIDELIDFLRNPNTVES